MHACVQVEIVHYNGGPCDGSEIARCVVTGGVGCGWTVVEELEDAIVLAHQRSYKRCEAQGDIRGGQAVRLHSLASAQGAPLNGECGIALQFSEDSGRWMVRLKDGGGKQLRPQNLEPVGSDGVVHCVWGDAQWSRTQLLGEIGTQLQRIVPQTLPAYGRRVVVKA